MKGSVLPRQAALLLAVFVLVAGCSAPRETASVTNRTTVPVEVIESTETAAPESTTEAAAVVRTIEPGRFDGGKMWTFDDPPRGYFEEAYDFEPDEAWFERARLGALRFSTYCSASFVSPNGLIMTNHHCARQSVTDVTRTGENLLDNGFYASALDDERKVKDLYVDQLITIKDVTADVYAAAKGVVGDDRQVDARVKRAESIEKRMTDEAAGPDSLFHVEVIELYNGGKYSAYTFRRYKDVRIVMAPELQIGFFGGDYDNFTYPRYNLDVAFFRAYDADSTALDTEHYFPFSSEGASDGETVFVIGNPGGTSRLNTVSQLEFERDFALPQQLAVMEARAAIMKSFIDEKPEEAEKLDLRNTYFSIQNSIKANRGQLAGLGDPELIARRRGSEGRLRKAIAESPTLAAEYRGLFRDIEDMQRAKEAVADQAGAFTMFSSDEMTSHVLLRALYGYVHDLLKQRGAPPERIAELKKGGLEVKDWPIEVERAFIEARLNEMVSYLGADHPSVRAILHGSNPGAFADSLVAKSALTDSTGFAKLLESGYLASDDPTVPVIESIASLFFTLGQQVSEFETREKNLNAQLGRALFAVYGTAVPPDASFSLRLADGVVKGYAYNGTAAPAFTTFYGLYDRHFAFEDLEKDWELPERWENPPATFDPSTPVNLVSTNDITGGNSGSPLLNKDLEVVGLAFDSNIEALPNEYLYLDVTGRTISVDSRGILEALDDIYDSDRIVLELKTGQLAKTEEEADAIAVD